MLSRRRFLLAAPLLTLAGCSQRAEPEPFLIGHVGPLSGPERQAGEHMRRGILLAVEEANTEAPRKISVLHADSRGQAERARSETVRLVSLNRLLALIGGLNQAEADQLAQALQPYPTLFLTAAPHTSVSLTNAFSLDVSPAFRGTALAKFAAEHFKATRTALLVDETSPVCVGVATAFANAWRSGERVAHTWNAAAEDSATTLVERLKKVEAELIVFAGTANDFLTARRTLTMGKVMTPMLFGGEPAEWQWLERNADVGRDVFSGAVLVTSRFDEAGKKFLTKYKERYHEDADADACRGYELLHVLAPKIRNVKGGGTTKLLEELKDAKDLPGLNGAFWFKEGHAVRPLYIVRARDPIPLETIVP